MAGVVFYLYSLTAKIHKTCHLNPSGWKVRGVQGSSGKRLHLCLDSRKGVADFSSFPSEAGSMSYELVHIPASDFSGRRGVKFYNLQVSATTQDPVTDGSMAWIVARTVRGVRTDRSPSLDPSLLDLTGIPTREISFNHTGGTSRFVIVSAEFSVLMCRPKARIETREVKLDGGGGIVVTYRPGLGRQGNLYDGQTALLLTQGPNSGYEGIGRTGQSCLFFGSNLQNSSANLTIKPISIENKTIAYGFALQAELSSYLSGRIRSAYVPGRLQEVKLVFQSSLPQVIASTVLFGLTTLFVVVYHFRCYTGKFTLFTVAATLARSDIPEVFEGARGDSGTETAVQDMERNKIQLGSGHSLRMT
ncbi:hypothetical protein PM082_016541 [Marasmius tenuissimus]|nr:hypothetical protein PM082_016541 [Marasmius tenuissimus]